MNHHVIRYRDCFIGIKGFGQQFPEDFPAGSDQAEQMTEISAVIDLIEQYGGDQALELGNVRFDFNSKGISREKMRGLMNEISTIAGTYAYTIPGIDLVFHIPKGLSDAALLALARSFAAQAVQYEALFKKRGLEDHFIQNLLNAVAEFEASLLPPETSSDAKVEATAKLGDAVRRGAMARNILKGILKIKYKNSHARMQAWLSASHLERPNKPDKNKNKVTPPPTG